jgi:hypothetical protein
MRHHAGWRVRGRGDSGVLSDAEFNEIKSKIFSRQV